MVLRYSFFGETMPLGLRRESNSGYSPHMTVSGRDILRNTNRAEKAPSHSTMMYASSIFVILFTLMVGWISMLLAVQSVKPVILDLQPEDIFDLALPTFYDFAYRVPILEDCKYTMIGNDFPELIIRYVFHGGSSARF
jgi:hypothetical protein